MPGGVNTQPEIQGVHSVTTLTMDALVERIRQMHEMLVAQGIRAVNISLTVRNWAIGYYIEEYERGGADRSQYGERLIEELAERLTQAGLSNCSRRQLYRYCDFYRAYPGIVGTLSPQLRSLLPGADSAIVGTASPQSDLPIGQPLNSLSYSHFELLVALDDDLKRRFYELEAIRGQWSVRELRRQITTLAFERTALSTDKPRLLEQIRQGAEADKPTLVLRDPYVFEFLGIRSEEAMGESRLEDALLDKVQQFLLELGRGFCFEARQKRILIGDELFFVDLVFYHRILKCHILIELKIDEFKHEHLGQLNTYVNWFRKHETVEGDNPPVGLLLCTRKNHALMEYALAGMDNQLFVSRYQLELPRKEDLEKLLEDEMRDRSG
jgi:predicted nuclease of restriction endonuclease-like (RecB) superfamily